MVVCGQCADRLLLDLEQVPGLVHALEAAHTKGLRFSTTRRPRVVLPAGEDQEEAPLPFEPRATETARLLHDALASWADTIAAHRGLFPPLDTAHALPAWLCGQVPWLRSAACGPEAVAKLCGVIGRVRAAVDRPPDLEFAGPCGASVVDEAGLLRVCRADLYARRGDEVAECDVCGATYPLDERRTWLLDRVDDMLLPASELARAVDGLGVDVTPSAIWKWKERGRLLPHGTDAHGHPLYRVGDVRDLVAATAERTAAR